MLTGMRAHRPDAKEVDCGSCVSSRQCWPDGAMPNAGFTVRRVRPLEPGEILFREGSAFEAPYLVTSGCVTVTELLSDGAERIVAFRVRGEVLGLESWNRGTHRYAAQALTSSTVCRLRWGAGGAAARSAAVLRALLAKAAAQSTESCMPWPGLPAVERVRAFVADFRARTGQRLPMTRAQIGRYLGLAEETVVRALKALERGV
jgi:CRP/FNR family transcriptional regulator